LQINDFAMCLLIVTDIISNITFWKDTFWQR